MTFGERIRAFREQRKLSQSAFGRMCNWSTNHIHLIETGKIKPPRDFLTDMHNAFPDMDKREWQDLLKCKMQELA